MSKYTSILKVFVKYKATLFKNTDGSATCYMEVLLKYLPLFQHTQPFPRSGGNKCKVPSVIMNPTICFHFDPLF